MKTNNILAFLTLFLVNCNSPNKEIKYESNKDSLIMDNVEIFEKKIESIKSEETNNFEDSIMTGLNVNILTNIENQGIYFIPLNFNKSYNDNIYNEINSKVSDVIYQDYEMVRKRINDSIAIKYFLTDKLDTLLVFNEKQILIDTLFRSNYEYYENLIEGSFVSTYNGRKGLNNFVVVSYSKRINDYLKKSPEIQYDTLYSKRIIDKLNLNEKNVYKSGFFVNGLDTISYINEIHYSTLKTSIYILKNFEPVDTIQREFIITNMTPVPLANSSEIFYVYTGAVPETDHFWTSIVSINLKKLEFTFYQKNRIRIK